MASSAQNSSFAPFSPTLPAGYVLHSYIIEKVLGKGNFGITYLAREEMTDFPVVIKENFPSTFAYRDPMSGELRPMLQCEESYRWALESFEKEARTLRKLPKHTNLVHVTGVFRALNTAYIVMEPIDGKNLAELYPHGSKMEPQLPESILRKLLNALEPLHRQGIIHRDIKPANIMLTPAGEPVLIDFGAARPMEGTHTATKIGTRGYAPPEQWSNSKKCGPWTDIYALGATCYYLITGEAPPDSSDRMPDDCYSPLATRPELQGRFSPTLLASVDKSLALRTTDRWQSAQQWLDELDAEQNRKPKEECHRKAEEEQQTQCKFADEKQKSKAALLYLPIIEKINRLKTSLKYGACIMLGICLLIGCVKLLMADKVDNNSGEISPSLAKIRLQQQNIYPEQYNTYLLEVAKTGNSEQLSHLIAAGADVNTTDEFGWFPLYWAAFFKKTKCFKLLIDAGADINKENNSGYTLLLWAVEYGHTECVKLLIAAGADVNKASENGRTPLRAAKTEEIKQLLRAAGANK